MRDVSMHVHVTCTDPEINTGCFWVTHICITSLHTVAIILIARQRSPCCICGVLLNCFSLKSLSASSCLSHGTSRWHFGSFTAFVGSPSWSLVVAWCDCRTSSDETVLRMRLWSWNTFEPLSRLWTHGGHAAGFNRDTPTRRSSYCLPRPSRVTDGTRRAQSMSQL